MNETIALSFSNATMLPVQLVYQTNWSQYIFSAIIGSIGVMWLVYILIRNFTGILVIRWYLARLNIMTKRKSILIAHHDSDSIFSMSMITRKDVLALSKALRKYKGKELNIILHTPGGDAFAGLLMSRMIKAHDKEVHVYVPQYAMSGGTLLALSGTSIHMNNYACLGPVDPQVGSLFGSGPAAGWDEIIRKKGKKADDKSYLYNRSGRQAEKMIYSHIKELCEGSSKKAEFFTDGRYIHGHPFTRELLKKEGIPTTPISEETGKVVSKIVSIRTEETVVTAT